MPRPKLRYCKYGHDIAEVGRQGSCCSECRRNKTRTYRDKNKDKVNNQSNGHKRLKRYGITELIYEGMKQQQGNRCAICGSSPTKRELAIDHDHKTGKVRGLLCGLCNSMLGLAKDKVEILQAGIEYLTLN